MLNLNLDDPKIKIDYEVGKFIVDYHCGVKDKIPLRLVQYVLSITEVLFRVVDISISELLTVLCQFFCYSSDLVPVIEL